MVKAPGEVVRSEDRPHYRLRANWNASLIPHYYDEAGEYNVMLRQEDLGQSGHPESSKYEHVGKNKHMILADRVKLAWFVYLISAKNRAYNHVSN